MRQSRPKNDGRGWEGKGGGVFRKLTHVSDTLT